MNETDRLDLAISEYKSLLPVSRSNRPTQPDAENLVRNLCRTHDWTDGGAREIVSLANDYGTFMLRNALALAIALNKEDGNLKF